MASLLSNFTTFESRFLRCSRRSLYLFLGCLTAWVFCLVIFYSFYLKTSSEVLNQSLDLKDLAHYVGSPVQGRDTQARTLGLFGSPKCLLLDVDPFHAGIVKNHWDLGSLKCHGGTNSRVYFKEKKLHVEGKAIRDVSYRVVKLSNSSTNDHAFGVSYSKEHLFLDSIARLERGISGPIAHYLGKCIHPEDESEDPLDGSGLMLYDCDVKENRYNFTLEPNGTLKHGTSGKCVVPLKDNQTTFLVFSAQCGDEAKFAPLLNGFVQHVSSRKCMHYSSLEEFPPNEVSLVLLPDCSRDMRQRFGWSDHFQKQRESVSDVELVSSSDIRDEFVEVEFISQESSPRSKEREYRFQILPKMSAPKSASPPTKPKMNILLMMFHSTSSAQFQRRMPKTHAFLADQLKSVFFKGFSVVDESTRSQLATMLSGTQPHEIDKQDADSVPWLFKLAKEHGYVTLLSEDKRHLATNSDTLQFKGAPTDHYAAPFWASAYKHSTGSFCIGNRPIHNITLSYLKQFFTAYPTRPKFAVAMNTEISSWNINSLGYADEDVAEFLRWMKEEGHLDNTVLVLFSDHGSRSDKMRQTLQGKIEERMPFLSVTLPLEMTTNLSSGFSNLKLNSRSIVSPYDIYTTLRHIVSPLNYTHNLGGNLLDRLNADSRSCDQLKVPPQWCPCLSVRKVNSVASLVRISKEVIASINKNKDSASCPEQRFAELKSAITLTPLSEVLSFQYSKNSGKCTNCEPVYGKEHDLTRDVFLVLDIRVDSGQVYRAVVNFLDGSFHTHPHVDLIEGQKQHQCNR